MARAQNPIAFRLQQAPSWLLYRLGEYHRHGHGIHSPFMFRFVNEVLEADENRQEFSEIERVRAQLYTDHKLVHGFDAGAGSAFGKNRRVSLGKRARRSSIKPAMGRLLCRLVRDANPELAIELGSAVGLGTAYLAYANRGMEVLSIEGNAALVPVAQKTWKSLGLENIRMLHTSFEEGLKSLPSSEKRKTLVWLDGDHRGEALLNYLEILLPGLADGSILVLDDIRWSGSMHKAWKIIIQDSRFSVSCEFWNTGILFVNNSLQKQHYRLKFSC